MSYALDSMVSTRTRPKIPVLFLIDEFLALGNFPKFANALNTHRGAGVRLWYILQDTPSLEDIYGIKWKSFFAAAEVKCYMGTRDHFTAEMISNMLGNKTLAYTTTSTSGNVSISGKDASFFEAGTKSTSMSYGRSTSTQVTSRPLLNPQEIQDILGHVTPDQARFGLIDLAGASPVQTILRPWYTSTFYQARLDVAPIKPAKAFCSGSFGKNSMRTSSIISLFHLLSWNTLTFLWGEMGFAPSI